MTGIVELALIRHGLPDRVEGVLKPDPGLTAAGLHQADAVSDALAFLPIRAIASSGLKRAQQTAAPSAQRLGLDVRIDDDLAEFDNGADFYIPIEDMVAEADPRLVQWRVAMADPDTMSAIAEFRRRSVAAVNRVARVIDEGCAAIFCHGGVIGACVEEATGAPRLSLSDPGYGSITRIVIAPDGAWQLRTYNEIHHVERQLSRLQKEQNDSSR